MSLISIFDIFTDYLTVYLLSHDLFFLKENVCFRFYEEKDIPYDLKIDDLKF